MGKHGRSKLRLGGVRREIKRLIICAVAMVLGCNGRPVAQAAPTATPAPPPAPQRVDACGGYQELPARSDSVLCSETFCGLWLDAAALLRLDLPRVKDVLEQGLRSPEHAAFAAKLASAVKS